MQSTQNTQKRQRINVYLRQRPLNKSEQIGQYDCIKIRNCKELEVQIKNSQPKSFQYDYVFGPDSKQVDIYYTVLAPLIVEVLKGYNCTVFAYGQTGTGKTYTIAGAYDQKQEWQSDPLAGLIPRAGIHIFEELEKVHNVVDYTVAVSFVELYNEELRDLLHDSSDAPPPLKMFGDSKRKGSVIIQNLSELTVFSAADIFNLLNGGMERRHTAATLLNDQSSRSHSVFTISVHVKETLQSGVQAVRSGKLNLVDLAGSENVSRSGAVSSRAREAGNINQSLLTLGRVIKGLVEHQSHIPYRDSKLTRILQDSLGGRTKTSIIATVSPSISCIDETLSTLEYAKRARNIQNCPEASKRYTKEQVISVLSKSIGKLKRDIAALRTGSGFYVDKNNYEELLSENEKLNDIILSKNESITRLEGLLCEQTDQKKLEEEKWKALMESFEFFKSKQQEYRIRIKKNKFEAKLHKELASLYEKTSLNSCENNRNVLNVIDKLTANLNKVHDTVSDVYETTEKDAEVKRKLVEKFNEIKGEIEKKGSTRNVTNSQLLEQLNVACTSSKQANDADYMERVALNENLQKSVENKAEVVRSCLNNQLGLTKEFEISVQENMAHLNGNLANSITCGFSDLQKSINQFCSEKDKRKDTNLKVCTAASALVQQYVDHQKSDIADKYEKARVQKQTVSNRFEYAETLLKEDLHDTREEVKILERMKEEIEQLLCQKKASVVESEKHIRELVQQKGKTAQDLGDVLRGYQESLEKLTAIPDQNLKMAEFTHNVNNLHESISLQVMDCLEDARNVQENLLQKLQSMLNLLKQQTEDICRNVNEDTDESSSVLMELLEQCRNFVTESIDSNKNSQQSKNKSLENILGGVSKLTDLSVEPILNILKGMEDQTKHIIHNELLKLESSGSTPQKPQYVLPQTLNVVSPLSKVSARCATPNLDVSINSLDVSSNISLQGLEKVEDLLTSHDIPLDETIAEEESDTPESSIS